MADVKYLNNRLKYHTASRVGAQTGYSLAQSLDVDGHIVTTNKVWAATANAFPNNADKENVDSVKATTDLVAVFKAGATSTAFWNGGLVWTNPNYPAVRLYENVPMTTVTGSDGGGKFQAYEILAAADGMTRGTIRLTDWVAPTAVADQTNGKPVAGFAGIPMYDGTALKLADTTNWAEAGGHWEFVYIAGMLTFEPGYTPENQTSGSKAAGITLTAFKYIGDYLTDSITAINGKIESLKVQAGGQELATGIMTITGDTVTSGTLASVEVITGTTKDEITGVETSTKVTLSGTITENGKVTISVPGEVISVKEGTVSIFPDQTFDTATGITTITADYGALANIPANTKWSITFRII